MIEETLKKKVYIDDFKTKMKLKADAFKIPEINLELGRLDELIKIQAEK